MDQIKKLSQAFYSRDGSLRSPWEVSRSFLLKNFESKTLEFITKGAVSALFLGGISHVTTLLATSILHEPKFQNLKDVVTDVLRRYNPIATQQNTLVPLASLTSVFKNFPRLFYAYDPSLGILRAGATVFVMGFLDAPSIVQKIAISAASGFAIGYSFSKTHFLAERNFSLPYAQISQLESQWNRSAAKYRLKFALHQSILGALHIFALHLLGPAQPPLTVYPEFQISPGMARIKSQMNLEDKAPENRGLRSVEAGALIGIFHTISYGLLSLSPSQWMSRFSANSRGIFFWSWMICLRNIFLNIAVSGFLSTSF